MLVLGLVLSFSGFGNFWLKVLVVCGQLVGDLAVGYSCLGS